MDRVTLRKEMQRLMFKQWTTLASKYYAKELDRYVSTLKPPATPEPEQREE